MGAMFHPDGPTFMELVQQALTSTEKGYDLIARKFDRTPFRTPDGMLDGMAKVIAEGGPVGSALDVCCGTGAALGMLRPLCRDRVVGVDFSQGMLDEAGRRLATVPGTARVELLRKNAFALDFDRAFDVVTSVGAFGHVEPKDEAPFLEGIFRALVPGGRFVFVTSEPPRWNTPAFWMAHGFNGVMRARNAVLKPAFIMYYLTFLWPEVRGLLERHGFRVEARRSVLPEPFQRGIVVVATRPV